MKRETLDSQISDAVGLVSLVLVFLFAYFSALLPLIESQIVIEKPTSDDAVAALRQRLLAYMTLMLVLFGATAAAMLVLLPLSWHVVQSFPWHGRFYTVRAGLLLLDILFIGTAVACIVEWDRVRNRRKELA